MLSLSYCVSFLLLHILMEALTEHYCFNFDILLETIMDIILSSSYHWLGRTLRMVCMEILQEKASKGHERQKRKN